MSVCKLPPTCATAVLLKCLKAKLILGNNLSSAFIIDVMWSFPGPSELNHCLLLQYEVQFSGTLQNVLSITAGNKSQFISFQLSFMVYWNFQLILKE